MIEIKTVVFTFSIKELIAAQQIYNQRISRKELRGLILVGVVVIFLAIAPLFVWDVFFPQEDTISSLFTTFKALQFLIWPAVGLIILIYVLPPLLVRFQIWQSYRANKNLYQNLEIRFTDQGIDFVRVNANSHFDWSYFQSVIDHKDLFLIVYGSNLFTTIPKRVLLKSQIPILAKILKDKINKYENRE
jgi:hypothetical protein